MKISVLYRRSESNTLQVASQDQCNYGRKLKMDNCVLNYLRRNIPFLSLWILVFINPSLETMPEYMFNAVSESQECIVRITQIIYMCRSLCTQCMLFYR